MREPVASDSGTALITDLYELTMAASYHAAGMNRRATFDLFVRELPKQRNFLIACGLDRALNYLENLHFESEDLRYLRSLGMFDEDFLRYLDGFRFDGEVWAIAEGEAAFEQEPLLRVTAPLIEAQIVETFLLNCITFQTMVASKSARVQIACADKSFVDFSLRRDHGVDAGLYAARASYIAGATATSNVLAGKLFGIPVTGTMAHSYVMAFESELDAFRRFASDFPDNAVLLIDTYDVLEGARRAVTVASEGLRVAGVRIDSGDLDELARSVRRILDDAGMDEIKIVVSGDLDEYRIDSLVTAGAPIDSFGVGTQMGTSADAPFLGGVYKLVEDESGPKMKLSAGKATIPGIKQVWRVKAGSDGHDLIGLADEDPAQGRPLLQQVMRKGRRELGRQTLEELQQRCRAAIARLPERLRSLEPAEAYEVRYTDRLRALVPG